MRENERLQGEIRRSTDEVADLQFQLLRYQTTTLTEAGAREETKAVTAPATKGGAEEQEVPMTPATPPDAVRSSANSSLLLESPGWGLSTELMSMADALEKDFMLRSTVAQQPEPMPQKQQQRQQPVVKRSVKSQSSSDDGRGNTAAPDLSAHTSPSSTSPAGSVGRRSRLSLQRRKSEAANMRAEDSKSAEIQQKAREKEKEERERREREKKEEEERERREKENEDRERREKQEREKKEKEERERREKTERERREREAKEKEERERREKKEQEERERERREREKKEKEERERERERREKEKTEQEEKERKRKEKEEHEANEKAREKQKRSEAMSASGVSRGQARSVPPGGPDSRASRPTGLKEGKRAIDETREDVETAQAPHASRPPATPTEESRSPTKKQKVDDQQDEGALYLDGINLLRAEQNYEDGRTSTTQPAKRPKSLKKQLEEERLQRDYRSIRSFFSFNAKKLAAADGACSAAVSPRLSPPRQIAAAATSPPRTEPADPPPAPTETAREGGGGETADPPQEEAMTDQERKKLARSRARAASDPKKTPRFVFGENCPGCATWMSKSDITSGMQDTAEASQTRCASCKHVFAPSVEVTFSVGREQKEDRKERVHFFDKVRLEAVAKERYKQGGRKSFTITLLAEERTDLFWNLVYHFGSLKDAVCAIFPTLNWNAVFRPSPKTT